jgi:ubiquinone/menaquinone biosynthesis C-methylase UbiE
MIQKLRKLIPVIIIDRAIFYWQRFCHARSNYFFRRTNPQITFPNAYTLYESYQLDYKKYWEDGEQTAKEIVESIDPYLTNKNTILDWGCGPSRITRHLQKFAASASIYACDPNIETILWNQKNIPNIRFEVQEKYPPLPFQDNYFDLLIGFSVLTHIPSQEQRKWLHEIHRILKPNGVAWLTTHGHYFIKRLSKKEKREIESSGVYNTRYHQTGHRMMSTYHLPEKWKRVLEEKFEILEYRDGERYPNKAGKQDLWILRKRKV